MDAAMAIVIHAWQDLDTCRSIGWSLGPIPWLAIASWAEFYEFDHDAAILLTRTIRKLDSHHLETIAARKRLADLK